jgi:hypothetical protein
VSATLTSRVSHNPFVCHSYRKHPGWGPAIVNFFVAQISDLAVRQVTSHKSPVTASALFLPTVTGHQSQVTKSFTIRTYEKHARNSRRIRTSKTQDLKLFRINTYKKTGRGARPDPKFRPSVLLVGRGPICPRPLKSARPEDHPAPPRHQPRVTAYRSLLVASRIRQAGV